MSDRIIKTITPFVVGWIISLLTTWGIDLPEDQLANITNALTLIFGAIYYVVVVLISKRWPEAERFLGSSKKPTYIEPVK